MRNLQAVYDPYDLWATDLGIWVRKQYYLGRISGKGGGLALVLLDWIAPGFCRYLAGAKPLRYPVVIAHEILLWRIVSQVEKDLEDNSLEQLVSLASRHGDEKLWSWGLGFPWMSKNGLYGPQLPFVTHTPYVMEALLALAERRDLREESMSMFHGTWNFLESLKVMHRGENELALSYAPVDEPRIVINANGYAAFAYAMHAVHGREEIRDLAGAKAVQLARWVIGQQQENGSWLYYADDKAGNFIDCFHSCFVIKNLLKVKRLIPGLAGIVEPALEKGWAYIQEQFFDEARGLCRRFTVHAQRDPFRWDLYDQAEYLGLLVDFGELARARVFALRAEKRFRRGKDWYCRIDIFGRRWGCNFLRWGITPFWYHRARLERALSELV